MDNLPVDLYYSLMASSPDRRARILISLFHTPSDLCQQLFYGMLRAGHILTGPGYRIERKHYPGHEFLFCLKGQGNICVSNRTWHVYSGNVAWIDCSHSHAHWPDPNEPWELYWMRVEGGNLNPLHQALTRRASPVFSGVPFESTKAIYEEIFRLLLEPSPAMEARLHAQVSILIPHLYEACFGNSDALSEEPLVPETLKKCLETMRLYYHRPLRVPELARMAGTSVSHFFRIFKKSTGLTPIQWLKRERINQAKQKLIETEDPISEIAEKTGYSDQFYFSRDFKRMTRMTPSEYRFQERTVREK